ncbi:MAG: aromatic ring-hydroxylating dioxygenase subunit alpha [Xanthobacteraceae bacterium]|nr:aromatic ring-hydroxylating dioxygenase subunit alpha [Xanthobacteraceae bacterium]
MTVLGAFEPEDILNPDHYRQARANGRIRFALPPWCYTSDKFLKAELQRVFHPNWNLIDRTDRVPNPGDFFCTEYLGTPMIVARGNDGEVRVFANACRHRSAQVAQGEGSTKMFRCPYHAWAYDLKGALIGAPSFNGDDDNSLIDDGNRKSFGLIEIPSAVWAGFLFVRFTAEGQSLEEQLGDIVNRVASHRPQDMVCTRRKVIEIDSNWKLFYENVNETYHIPFVHGGTLDRQKRNMLKQDNAPNFTAIMAQHEGSRLVIKGDQEFPRISTLEGQYGTGTYYVSLFPATQLVCSIDAIMYYKMEPLSASRTRMTMGSCFPKETVARPDFEEVAQNYYKRVDLVTPEDYVQTDSQQIGLSSPFARSAPLGNCETMMYYFDQWLLDRIVGHNAR